VAIAACSLLLPLNDQQCSATSDCAARGGAFAKAVCESHVCVPPAPSSESGAPDAAADPWFCLGLPSQVTSPTTQVTITFTVFDALSPVVTAGPQGGSDFTVISGDFLPGVSIEACDSLDPTCARPVTPLVVTGDAGQATLSLPQTFVDFVQLTNPNYLTAKVYMGRLLADASTFSAPIAFLGTQEASLLAVALGVPFVLDADGGLGEAFFEVFDCFDRLAPGVTFTMGVDAGPQTVQWYTKNQLPSTTTNVTDALGTGGAVNVPSGALTVTATLAATNRTLGSVNAYVAAGETTLMWVRVRTH
jgi:hypothetical protein